VGRVTVETGVDYNRRDPGQVAGLKRVHLSRRKGPDMWLRYFSEERLQPLVEANGWLMRYFSRIFL